ncbi:MAG TPA: sce7726 family protein [Opitutaceae bacterium]|nr:sce7726 family protein [Opitutaceae bacterium]
MILGKEFTDIALVIAMTLNDARIREALLRKLAKQKARPRAVLEELHVHNGRAIADVVTLHAEAHCYEIKGATDRIERIVAQGAYYNAAFRRITLVTTECNLKRARKLAPRFWGIIVAVDDGEVRLRHVRAAKFNPNFEKQSAAMTLWKSEMLELVSDVGAKKKPRRLLAELIAETRRELELSTSICDLLLGRSARAQNFAPITI